MESRVKLLRQKIKKTMKEVSEEVGIGISTISSYENGYSMPKKQNAQKLADYFGVSVPYLLGLEDLREPSSDPRYTLKALTQELGQTYFEVIETLEELFPEFTYTSFKRDRLEEIKQEIRECKNKINHLEIEADKLRQDISDEIAKQIQ